MINLDNKLKLRAYFDVLKNNRKAQITILAFFIISAFILFSGREASNLSSDISGLKNIPELPDFKLPPQKKQNIKDPYVSMNSGVLIDANSFYPLWQKNAHLEVPIASTTKIISAIVIIENYDLGEEITISQKAATQIGSEVFLKPQEKISTKSLLKALLIQSGNDAAYALAEKIGVDNFVTKMNEKAKTLEMNDSSFKDPAGLDDDGKSSAIDLAKASAYAMKLPQFTEIVKTPEDVVYSVDGRNKHSLDNSNRLVKGDSPYFLPYALGIKTGFTPLAGHCLVSYGRQNNHDLISVVLSTTETQAESSAKESRKLLEWGFNSFNWN